MERLTYRENGKWRLRVGDTEFSGEPADKLAAYEDTVLEPEEIIALCEMNRRAKMVDMLRLEESTGVSVDRLRELVLQEREERNKGWISVKDRQPEVGKPVLTYGRKGSIGIGFFQQKSCNDGKFYFYARYGDHLPTHWMPLPEPLKGVDNG